MIVVDASIVVTAFLDQDPRGVAAQRRLDTEDLAAPELIDVEVLHAFRGLVRGRRLDVAQGESALATFAGMRVERFSHTLFLRRAWALRDNLSAYDATYVALAELLEVPLLTADRRLAGAPGLRCAVELIS